MPLSAEFKQNILSDLKARLYDANFNQNTDLFKRTLTLVKLAREKGCFEGMDTQSIKVGLIMGSNYLDRATKDEAVSLARSLGVRN